MYISRYSVVRKWSKKGLNFYVLQLIFLSLAIHDVETANYKKAVESKPIVIECGKRAIKPGDKVTWSKGEERDLNSLPRFTVNDKGYLYITQTNKNDSGVYTCTKRMKGKDLTDSVNMYIKVELSTKVFE